MSRTYKISGHHTWKHLSKPKLTGSVPLLGGVLYYYIYRHPYICISTIYTFEINLKIRVRHTRCITPKDMGKIDFYNTGSKHNSAYCHKKWNKLHSSENGYYKGLLRIQGSIPLSCQGDSLEGLLCDGIGLVCRVNRHTIPIDHLITVT